MELEAILALFPWLLSFSFSVSIRNFLDWISRSYAAPGSLPAEFSLLIAALITLVSADLFRASRLSKSLITFFLASLSMY